jgi:nucleotide-binding universal stress UspA family protein
LAGVNVTLVTAWHWPTSYGIPVAYEGFGPEEDARKVVEAGAADMSIPRDRIKTVVEQGSAGDVLVAAAKPGDVLVVGSRGHGSLAGALVGSTSAYCVHHATCPVVVVR